MTKYKHYNRQTGITTIEDKEYWRKWAESFYGTIMYKHLFRDEKNAPEMPSDWWERTQRVLKLERV